ncbi:hypothetical protein ACU686_03840 [Yinghuangia aomiensis]
MIDNATSSLLDLGYHNGDANWPRFVPGYIRTVVSFSTRSFATYEGGPNGGYSVTLDVNSSGQEQISCSGLCTISADNVITFH